MIKYGVKMEQTGRVLEVKQNKAFVKVVRGTACGENCGQCNICEDRDNKRWMLNDAKAKKGDTVLIEMLTSRIIFMAFVAYILPIIIGTVCYILLWAAIGKGAVTDLVSFVVIVASIFIVAKRNPFSKDKYQSRITEILKKEAENE